MTGHPIRAAIKKIIGPNAAEILKSGRNTLRTYPHYILGHGKAGRPDHLTIEVTYRCNVRCRMCPYHGEHMDDQPDTSSIDDELTTAQIIALLNEAARLGVKDVMFTGGETLLRKDILELVAHARNKNLRTVVLTSGSVGNEKLAAAIVDSGLNALAFSIDGPAEVHDNIRRVPGLFARADRFIMMIRAIQAQRRVAEPSISVNCTVSAMNQDSFHEIIEAAARWKVLVAYHPIFFSVPSTNGTNETNGTDVKPEDWRLAEYMRKTDPSLIARSLETARRMGAERGVLVWENIGREEEIQRWFYDYNYSRNNKCMFPWWGVRVSAFGDVYPCSMGSSMGNLRENSLGEIWNCPTYVAFRRDLRKAGLFAGCTKCCQLNPHDLMCRIVPRLV